MACENVYLYYEIFKECGEVIRTLLLDPEALDNNPTNVKNPYPIYETITDYNANTVDSYKGLLVWNARKYYTAIASNNTDDTYISSPEALPSLIGFYVVPVFGNVSIRSNVEYKQLLTVTFDTNSDNDYDPYGTKISETISVFTNNVYRALEYYGNELPLDVSRHLYTRVVGISRPINVGTSVFERRAVTIELRYCHCF